MSSRPVIPPFQVFNDTDGTPLENGYIYVGVENLDPATNPISIYWDEELTITAEQPVRTLNGYPSRAGSPSQFFANSKYSILVKNKNGVTVYSSASSSSIVMGDLLSPDSGKGDELIAVKSSLTGAVATTQHEVNARKVSLMDFDPTADRTGFVDASTAFRLASASGATHISVPNGAYKVSGNNVISISNGQVWDFDDVTLDYTGTGSQICIGAVNCTDWGITGRLNIVGSGMASGTIYGLRVVGGQRYIVENVTAKNIPGWGIMQDSGGSFVSPRGDQGRFVNCAAYACWRGAEIAYSSTNEYTIWEGFQASGNGEWGVIDGSGNTQWVNPNIVDNVLGGFQVYGAGGGNSAHGSITGGNFNHNGSDNLFFDRVLNGYTVNGAHIYGDALTAGNFIVGARYLIVSVGTTDFTLIGAASNTVGLPFVATGVGSGTGVALGGLIHLTSSQGITITDGIIDTSVLADGVPAINEISNNYIAGANFFNTITGAAAKSLLLLNNWREVGPHINNDISAAYALAYRASSLQNLTSGVMADVVFNGATSDLRSNFDTTTGIFTCPYPGVYRVSASVLVIGATLPTGYTKIVKNSGGDADVTWAALSGIDSGAAQSTLVSDVICLAGDTLRVRVQATCTTPQVYTNKTTLSVEFKGGRTS